MKTRRHIIGKFALLASAIFVALLLAEGAVRLLGLAPVVNRINPEMEKTVFKVSENPLLGYTFKENYRDKDNADLKSSYPYINAHGFRDIERKIEKPAGTKRIILLGDSVVAGAVNIREIDDTISRQLESRVAGSDIEVLNMGVNGYCTRAEVELLQERGMAFSPDLVILLFVTNDYHDINSDLGMVSQPAIVERAFVHSHLFRNFAVRFNWFSLRTQLGLEEISGEFVGFLYEDQTDRAIEIRSTDRPESASVKQHLLSIGRMNVQAALPVLKQLSVKHGFNVVIAQWPNFYPDGIKEMERWTEFHELEPGGTLEIERLAQKIDVPFVSLTPWFIQDYERRKANSPGELAAPHELYASGDDMHVNALGAAVAAEGLEKMLRVYPQLLE